MHSQIINIIVKIQSLDYNFDSNGNSQWPEAEIVECGYGLIQKGGAFKSAYLELDSNGSTNLVAKFSHNKDKYITVGKAYLGYAGHQTLAGFGNIHQRGDDDGKTKYAILQDIYGTTYVGAADAKGIYFRNGNSPASQIVIRSGYIHFKGGDFMIDGYGSGTDYNSSRGFKLLGWINEDGSTAEGAGSTTGTYREYLDMKLFNTNIRYLTASTQGYIWMVKSSNPNDGMQFWCTNLNFNSTTGASDDRLKHNEKPINNALSTIRKLKPQVYDKASKLNDTINTIREAGLIAQEVYEIPELKDFVKVPKTDPDIPNPHPYWGLNYGSLFTYNIAATKELDSIVQTQQTEINELKEEMNTLKHENSLLKTKLNEILSEMGKEVM